MNPITPKQPQKAGTGVKGLDEILNGGLPRGEMHLIQGGPGTGKTTLALQFLIEGAARGEKAAFVTLAQTEEALRKFAASHGWPLDGIEIIDLTGVGLGAADEQTLFHTADVELGETTRAVQSAIERAGAERIVLDTIGQVRLLADSDLRYRREILSLRMFLATRPATVLFIDDDGETPDNMLADLSHGVILLERSVPDYGNVRRSLSVVKMRDMPFYGGNHNFRIRTGGIEVYPRLDPSNEERSFVPIAPLTSGIEELDALLGGGLEEGTASVIVGPTGTGKSTLATLYAYAAAKRGLRAALFCFDERPEMFLTRSAGLGMDLQPLIDQGLITLRAVSTAELSPGEFAQIVRDAVEDGGARVMLMDSLTGYSHAMPQEHALMSQLHDLLSFLSQRGVLSFLIVSQHGMLGEDLTGQMDISYMADSVILLRRFEAGGKVRNALSILKKRQGMHETTIRELMFGPGSIRVGEPLTEFTGVLSGQPAYQGQPRRLE